MLLLKDALPRTCALVQSGIEQGLHPGAQIYVSRGGQVICDDAIGESRPGVAMSPDTLLLWLSAGKPLGSMALAQLSEQGRLDLDAPVADVIPEFAAGGKQSIAPRHLLSHTGGFRLALGLGRDTPWDKAIDLICKSRVEPHWVVGETVGYHPETSWYIIGELVRRIDGRTYGNYVRDAIALPAGMADTWVGMPPEKYNGYGDRLGWTFDTSNLSNPRPNGWETETAAQRTVPGAGARGPARDLGKFYESLVIGNIVKQETLAEFTRPHHQGAFDKTFKHRLNWGLGFMLDSKEYGVETVPYGFGRHCSPSTFGHGGRESSAGCADPENRLAIGVIFNGMPGEAAHQARMRDCISLIYEDLGLIL